MTEEEIRFWLKDLRRRGWPLNALMRALGCEGQNWRRDKAWIYWSERPRFSRILKRIIAGELVWVAGKAKCGPNGKKRVVEADHPIPLAHPMKIAFDMKTGRLKMIPGVQIPHNRLPTFQNLLNDPPARRYRCMDSGDEGRS